MSDTIVRAFLPDRRASAVDPALSLRVDTRDPGFFTMTTIFVTRRFSVRVTLELLAATALQLDQRDAGFTRHVWVLVSSRTPEGWNCLGSSGRE
jgi:hypothetical protein